MKLVYLGYNPKTGRVEWTDQDAGIVMAESEVVPYRNFVEKAEKLIGRKLSKGESLMVHWLSDWDESVLNIISILLSEAYNNGLRAKNASEVN
jgi:hypothetical protein